MSLKITDNTPVLRIGLEGLARFLANRRVLSATCDPFTLSTAVAEIIKKSCSSLESQLKKIFSEEEFRVIAVADRSKSLQFRKWDLNVRSKNIALEVRASKHEDFFTIPEDKFNTVKTAGERLAKKLGLKLVVADYFYESETPDCGRMYEISSRGRTAAGKMKVAFAFAPKECCFISRGKAAEVCEVFKRAVLGKERNQVDDAVKPNIRARLLIKFRNQLISSSEN